MGATSHDVHIDVALSNMAIGYRPEGFIADTIMPMVPVTKQSDLYYIFSRADRLRRKRTQRSPGAEAQQIDQSVSSASFFAKNYALKAHVTLEDRENADPLILSQIVNGRATLVLDGLMLDWEIRVANQVTSGTNVGSYSGVASGWSGAGDPISDVNAAIDNVHYSSGIMPNQITFGVEAWKSFRRDSTVRDLIFGTNNGGGYPSRDQVANLFDMPPGSIQVAGAFQNTGDEGLSEALSTIWLDNVLVSYRPATPQVDRPSFAYSFRWSKPGVPNMQVERHPYDRKTKCEEVEVGYYQDEIITGTEYAFLLAAVNSST